MRKPVFGPGQGSDPGSHEESDTGEYEHPLRARIAAAIPIGLVLGNSEPNRRLMADAIIADLGLHPFTKFRQRHERGQISVMQASDMWMDGEWLWRIDTDLHGSSTTQQTH